MSNIGYMCIQNNNSIWKECAKKVLLSWRLACSKSSLGSRLKSETWLLVLNISKWKKHARQFCSAWGRILLLWTLVPKLQCFNDDDDDDAALTWLVILMLLGSKSSFSVRLVVSPKCILYIYRWRNLPRMPFSSACSYSHCINLLKAVQFTSFRKSFFLTWKSYLTSQKM